jgi:hypothetical protein
MQTRFCIQKMQLTWGGVLIATLTLSIALAAPLDPAFASLEADEMLQVIPKTISGSLVKISTSLPPMASEDMMNEEGSTLSSPSGAIQELPHAIHPLLQLNSTITSGKRKSKMNSDNMHE